jgi:hypothetical protein
MKIYVVHDKVGKIVAAVDITSNTNGPRPKPGKGHQELLVEVPAEHHGMSFLEICRGLKVDAKSQTLVAPRKETKKKPK